MPKKVNFVKAKSIPIKHGWFMDQGGVSAFGNKKDSLNGKYAEWDTPENVDENRRRAMEKLEVDGHLVHIIHNFEVEVLLAMQNTSTNSADNDAIITADPKVVISQTTADCGNIILYCPEQEFVALVHGSYHTLNKKIIQTVIDRLANLGVDPKTIKAAIGPMISARHYEFGHEAIDMFNNDHIKPHKERGKVYLDLPAIVKEQLEEAGVEQIEDVGICTYEDTRFASARRDGADSPRMITLAQLDSTM